jgi:hypothetical protein
VLQVKKLIHDLEFKLEVLTKDLEEQGYEVNPRARRREGSICSSTLSAARHALPKSSTEFYRTASHTKPWSPTGTLGRSKQHVVH